MSDIPVHCSSDDAWIVLESLPEEEKAAASCECMGFYLGIYFADNDLESHPWVYCLMSVSMVCDFLSFALVWRFKGLQSHPMQIFAALAMANFCYFWTLNLISETCKFTPLLQEATFNIFSDWHMT